MPSLRSSIAISLMVAGCAANKGYPGSENDRIALEQTSIAIRSAFARGDIPTIMAYHHPEVTKALGYNKYLKGRDAVEADLKGTFQIFNLKFNENQIETISIQGETAVEQTLFTIEGTPKDGGKPFKFKRRAMVVYVRYRMSPAGWASIREIIQPANE
jgi:ketosteroid isomerase-like protein